MKTWSLGLLGALGIVILGTPEAAAGPHGGPNDGLALAAGIVHLVRDVVTPPAPVVVVQPRPQPMAVVVTTTPPVREVVYLEPPVVSPIYVPPPRPVVYRYMPPYPGDHRRPMPTHHPAPDRRPGREPGMPRP